MKHILLFIIGLVFLLGLTSWTPTQGRVQKREVHLDLSREEEVRAPAFKLHSLMVQEGEGMLEQQSQEMARLKAESDKLYQQTLELQRLIRRKQSDVREHHP